MIGPSMMVRWRRGAAGRMRAGMATGIEQDCVLAPARISTWSGVADRGRRDGAVMAIVLRATRA
jgi:hypothetical protein